MTTGIQTVLIPVRDLDKAKKMFGAVLGVEPDMDQPYYVGYRAGGQDIGLDPHGHSKGMTGPVGYWHVDDINATIKQVTDAGATVHEDVKDVGGGKLVVVLKDADGNMFGLIQMP
ncbi:MAG: VOC family protein [Jiangellaceae bacterium]